MNTIETRILALFFAITFILSWLFFVPAAIFFKGVVNSITVFSCPQFIILQTLGAAVPSFVAILLIKRFYGKEILGRVFKRYTLWKLGKKWYFYSIFLYPLITLFSIAIYTIFKGYSFTLDPNTPLVNMINRIGIIGVLLSLPFIYITQIFSSPLLEEMGWRGLALPLLQNRFNALTSSVIIGLAWGAWHLPLSYVYNNGFTIINFLLTIDMIALSIMMTWLINNTKGSMLTALLFHASLNISMVVINIGEPEWISHILTWGFALVVLFINGAENLSLTERIRVIEVKS